MMTSLESHARHVLSVYAKDAGAHVESSLLEKLIADEIGKAVNENREELREKMSCDRRNPCAFNDVCAHHKALAGAMMATQLAHR
jgi:hypothetical protein